MIARVPGPVSAWRRVAVQVRSTIDIDTAEVEVCGRSKTRLAHNYLGMLTSRPHLATRAEAAAMLAADPDRGRDDPPGVGAPDLIPIVVIP